MKNFKEVLVFSLITDKPSPLVLNLENKLELDEVLSTYGGVYQIYLHFLSNDEIKKGDWYVHENKVYKSTGTWDTNIQYQISALRYDFHDSKNCKKIIASMDKSLKLPNIPTSFIKKYIEEYNKGNIIKSVNIDITDGILSIEPNKETWDDIFQNFANSTGKNVVFLDKGFEPWIKENYNVPTKIS